MNILFCYFNGFNPMRGGVQRVAYDLAQYFINSGINMYFLSGEHTSPVEGLAKENQFFLPFADLNNKSNTKFYDTLLVESKINIIVNHDAPNNRSDFFLNGFPRTDIKSISLFHNDPLVRISNAFTLKSKEKFGLLSPYVQLIKRFFTHKKVNGLLSKSDSLVVLSPNYILEIKERLNIESDKISHIYYPLNRSEIQNLRLDERLNQVIFVGRLDIKHKRVDTLLKIWEMVEQLNDSWELIIIGGGEDELELKNLALKLNLKRVKFTGFIDPTPYYLTSSISALTSDYEGSPMTLIESLFYGTVPITFDNWPSIKDFIEHEVNGILVKTNCNETYCQQLLSLMNNKENRLRLQQNHKLMLKKVEPNEVGEAWLTLFKKLLL